MDDWKAWIREIAYERIDQIESQLNATPDAFPEFTDAAGKLDAAMDETDAHRRLLPAVFSTDAAQASLAVRRKGAFSPFYACRHHLLPV